MAEAVIDTTGVFGNPNYLGPGGTPAVGESACRDSIQYGLPDILGKDRDVFANRGILVVGDGYSAATNLVALAELAAVASATQVTWITRHAADEGPVRRHPQDPLPQRDALAVQANGLATGSHANIQHLGGAVLRAIERDAESGKFRVTLAGTRAGLLECDCVLANVGNRPQREMYRELQVHECYATEGLMNVSAELLASASQDCLAQPVCGPEALSSPEPDFYVLGSKSYGRNSAFLFQHGLAQIRDVFTLIGDRTDLDLYRTIRPAAAS
jgi:hypothetical protein